MHSHACQRFRRLAALSVDGELSELGTLALARHLERCPSCSSFAATVARATGEIRATELEPVRVQWSPVREPRGVDRLARSALTLAGVACVAAFAGATLQAVGSRPGAPPVRPVLVIDASGADTARETRSFIRGLKDAALAREVGVPAPGEADRPGAKSS